MAGNRTPRAVLRLSVYDWRGMGLEMVQPLAEVTGHVRACHLQVMATQAVPFDEGGLTLVWVLAESHLDLTSRRPSTNLEHSMRAVNLPKSHSPQGL